MVKTGSPHAIFEHDDILIVHTPSGRAGSARRPVCVVAPVPAETAQLIAEHG